MRAKSGFLKGLNPTMAIWSKFLVFALVILAFVATKDVGDFFTGINSFLVGTMKWYYLGIVACFLFFVVWLLFSRYGNLRLGKDSDRPEFSYFSWFAMLFGAGMGIGLVFWSIAEPIYHFQSNPFITAEMSQSPEAAQVAMRITLFHWGLHPWAIYVIVGLTLAYFAYRKDLPLTIRSSLYPLIGERIYGPLGHIADLLAVYGTVFGVATSLGLGVQQMATGLYEITGWSFWITETVVDGVTKVEPALAAMMLLIAVVSTLATVSVVSGVGRGVKILSEVNLWLSIAILAFFFAFGPTRYLLGAFLQNIGDYLGQVVPLSLWTNANDETSKWQGGWTAFYWGWWISWAPFVGMFIARISRGRTIREFILGVLLVPTLLGAVWLTAFGGTALHIELFGDGGIVEAVGADLTSALYVTIDKMNAGFIGTLASIVATLLIATYFITSSDSGTLVVNTLLSMGDEEPPTVHRVIWGLGEGFVAAALLYVGGLEALQAAAIAAALPFSIIMIFMMIGLVKALRQEDLGQAYALSGEKVRGSLDGR
ncbi:BCCT family transporter [Kiloniella laminariae]|uniref:BCCT family transporter n=1 Tax=Kiloniella laminariae TaxID=454162 RepID=A0ABT4LID4_9PROT|nr:BCCT family transporter [Kiloniella laminariae]MCZ4280864.1 BCCT family transporter [Kiloniella laminariae]